MSIPINSVLEYNAGLNADGYTAGAKAIADGNKKIEASNRAVTGSFNDLDGKLSISSTAFSTMQNRYVAGQREIKEFNKVLRFLERETGSSERSIADLSAILLGAANRFGITADKARELAAAMPRAASMVDNLKGSFAAQSAEAARLSAAHGKLAASNDNASFAAANLSYQLQDIVASAISGQSAMTIGIQQGMQMSGAFGNAGAAGALRMFGSAFSTMLNPLSLVTIGLAAAAAAAIQWVTSTNSGTDTLSQTMEKHALAMEHIKRLYGESAKEAANLESAGGRAFSRAVVSQSQTSLKKQLQSQSQDMLQNINGSDGFFGGIASFFSGGGSKPGSAIKALTGDLRLFKVDFEFLIDSMRSGKTDMDGFIARVEKTGAALLATSENPEELRRTMDAVEALGSSLTEVGGKFPEFADLIRQLQIGVGEGNPNIEEFIAGVEKIGKQKGIPEKAAELISLSNEMVKTKQAMIELQYALDASNARVASHLLEERSVLGNGVADDRKRQAELEDRILDAQTKQLKALTDQERIAAAGELARARNPVNGPDREREVLVAERQERERLDQAWAQGEKARSDSRADFVRQSGQEINMIGMTAGEVARLRFEWQATEEARRAAAETGRAVSADEIATIRQQADEVGRLTEQATTLKALSDLSFDRSQIGRSADERQVYSEIHQLGLDINSSDGRRVADSIRINQQLEKQRDLADDMAQTFAGMFSQPIKDVDQFFSRLAGGFAKMGEQNLNNFFSRLMNGEAISQGGGRSQASAGSIVQQIGDGISQLFGGSAFSSSQQRMLSSSAAKLSVGPIDNAMGDVSSVFNRTTDTMTGTVARYADAIKKIESSGNYGALGPTTKSGDHAYGAYQVMGANIPSWTKDLLGYSMDAKDFLKDQSVQDRVFNQQFGKLLNKYGNSTDAISAWFSGQPLSVAATRSDGYNTTQQYVAKVNAAIGQLPEQIQTGVQIGTKEGLSVASKSAGNDPWSGLRQVGGPGLNKTVSGGIGGGAGGFLSAGLGGFGMGYQAQDPAMGALSGAMAGMATPLGPIGAIIGGIAGALGGLFGQDSARRQEMAQARDQLNSNQTLMQQLFAAGQGRGVGPTMQSYNQFYDKTDELVRIAHKAGDEALVTKLQDNVNKFFVILEKDFIGKLPGALDAYSSGFGTDSPFMKGAQQMEALREEVKNFVADVQDFGALQIKNNRGLTQEGLDAQVAEAQRAAQKMVLASITGVRELSGMESQILRLRGASSVAATSLEVLGMDAEKAAAAVSGAFDIAFAKLRDSFVQDVTGSISDLSGVGYINDVIKAQKAYTARLSDAAALGLDGSLPLRELSLSIRSIVKEASLGQPELAALSDAFPTLGFMFNAAATSSMSLSEATSQLDTAYNAQITTLDSLIEAAKSGITAIKSFRDAMRINDSSPLSPSDKIADAAKQFRTVADKAASGDQEALGQLTQISQSYLDAAQGYYASSTDYFQIWSEVDQTLSRVQTATEGQLNTATSQKAALDAQVSGILKVNDSVLSVKDALDQYTRAQSDTLATLKEQLQLVVTSGSDPIQTAYQSALGRTPGAGELAGWQSKVNQGTSVSTVVDAITGSREAQVNALYNKIFGRNLDAESRNFWLSSTKTISQIEADLLYSKSQGAYRMGGIVGAFANGGMVGNGIYNQDSVLARYAGGGSIALAGGEHVTRAPSVNDRTAPVLDYINRTGSVPGGDNAALIAEIRALRAAYEASQAELAAVQAVIAQGAVRQIAFAQQTSSSVAEMLSELKRANSR